MTPTPPRRWYQFKLSTILVLVGIAAWAMACGPWVSKSLESWGTFGNSVGGKVEWGSTDLRFVTPNEDDSLRLHLFAQRDGLGYHLELSIGPQEIIWPILALAVFITWKLGWAIVARP